MKKMFATVTAGLVLSGFAGVGLSAGLASPAGATTTPATTTAPATATAPATTTAPSGVPASSPTAKHPLRAWLRAHRRAVARDAVQISAHTIGVAPKALVSALHAGRSIAEVASSHNVDVQSVVHALVLAGDSQIGRAVDNHKLTPAQGSALEAALPQAVAKLVDHTFGSHSSS